MRINVHIAKQVLELYDDDKLIRRYSISTAKNGIGQHYGSMQTPLGQHRIAEKIGADDPVNTVFKARIPTGELYTPQLEAAHPERTDWILTRILWLEGLEAGLNKGGNVDSKSRKIYIHASPELRPMGQPFSHGCVCLHNENMLELFDSVEEGTLVNIFAD
jgi:lipoprotein-anchoring transpeptidase ErfK/SrfK